MSLALLLTAWLNSKSTKRITGGFVAAILLLMTPLGDILSDFFFLLLSYSNFQLYKVTKMLLFDVGTMVNHLYRFLNFLG